MSRIYFQDLVEEIIADPKPIAFVDTCVYLDLIRLFPKEYLDSNIFSACKTLANNLSSQPQSFWLLTADIVEDEWQEHSTEVLKSSDNWFKDLEKKIKRVKSIAPNIPSISNNYTYQIYSKSLGQHLFNLSKNLLDQTLVINHIEDLTAPAYKRVVSDIMPSSKGKSEIKDCYIFEVFLELSRHLRSSGLGIPIYFLTSNKNDFGSPTDSNGKIINDLNAVNATYINNWSWLKSELLPGV